MAQDEVSGGNRAKLHLSLICDCSYSMTEFGFQKLLIPACEQAYTKLRPDSCTAVLFGKNVTRCPIYDADDIKVWSPSRAMTTLSLIASLCRR